MKLAIITIVLGTALLLTANVPAESMLAMGAKDGAVQSTDNETDEGRSEGNQVKQKQSGDGLSSQESNTVNKGKSSPAKKPRLKYRDEPGCSC